MLVSDRVIENDYLLVFLLWHDKQRVFMVMHAATVILKSQLKLVIALYTVDG